MKLSPCQATLLRDARLFELDNEPGFKCRFYASERTTVNALNRRELVHICGTFIRLTTAGRVLADKLMEE